MTPSHPRDDREAPSSPSWLERARNAVESVLRGSREKFTPLISVHPEDLHEGDLLKIPVGGKGFYGFAVKRVDGRSVIVRCEACPGENADLLNQYFRWEPPTRNPVGCELRLFNDDGSAAIPHTLISDYIQIRKAAPAPGSPLRQASGGQAGGQAAPDA